MILRLFDGEHWGFAPTSWRKQSKVHGLSRPCLFPPSALSLPLKEVIPGKVFSLTFLRAFYLSAVAFVGNSLMPLWLLLDPRLEFPKQIASMQTHCCLWKSCSSPCLHGSNLCSLRSSGNEVFYLFLIPTFHHRRSSLIGRIQDHWSCHLLRCYLKQGDASIGHSLWMFRLHRIILTGWPQQRIAWCNQWHGSTRWPSSPQRLWFHLKLVSPGKVMIGLRLHCFLFARRISHKATLLQHFLSLSSLLFCVSFQMWDLESSHQSMRRGTP